MSFFTELLNDAEAALTVVKPLANLAADAVPVIETVAPQTAPVINTAEAALASIEQVAPGLATSTSQAIAAARNLIAVAGPEIVQLEQLLSGLFKKTTVGQVSVLTPSVTTATAV